MTDLVKLWCIHDDWYNGLMQCWLSGSSMETYLEAQTRRMIGVPSPWEVNEHGYVESNGTAHIPLEGPLSPHGFFGFGSTNRFRQALDHAVGNPNIEHIQAEIDSPGGQSEGTPETAAEFRAAGQDKSTSAQITGLGTSAAFHIAAQAGRVLATPSAWVGNVGVMAQLTDLSELFESAGIKVHPIVTGKFKGLGMPGVPVLDEHVEHIRGLVDEAMAEFSRDVQTGRSLSDSTMEIVKTGAIFSAERGLQLGLIDAIDASGHASSIGAPSMSEQDASNGLMSQLLNLFASGKIKVADESDKTITTAGEAVPGGAVAQLPTYEEGVQAGVDAAREQMKTMMELYTIAGVPDGMARCSQAIADGKTADDVRRELATERALKSSQDDDGESTDIKTQHVARVKTNERRGINHPYSANGDPAAGDFINAEERFAKRRARIQPVSVGEN